MINASTRIETLFKVIRMDLSILQSNEESSLKTEEIADYHFSPCLFFREIFGNRLLAMGVFIEVSQLQFNFNYQELSQC